MTIRSFLFFLGAFSLTAAQSKTPPTVVSQASQAGVQQASAALAESSAAQTSQSSIRFEDATGASGIHFTHSFGSAKLGSLLEGTGGGCLWFDFNNSGRPSLYAISGRPLADSMHPYPLKDEAESSAA